MYRKLNTLALNSLNVSYLRGLGARTSNNNTQITKIVKIIKWPTWPSELVGKLHTATFLSENQRKEATRGPGGKAHTRAASGVCVSEGRVGLLQTLPTREGDRWCSAPQATSWLADGNVWYSPSQGRVSRDAASVRHPPAT